MVLMFSLGLKGQNKTKLLKAAFLPTAFGMTLIKFYRWNLKLYVVYLEFCFWIGNLIKIVKSILDIFRWFFKFNHSHSRLSIPFWMIFSHETLQNSISYRMAKIIFCYFKWLVYFKSTSWGTVHFWPPSYIL